MVKSTKTKPKREPLNDLTIVFQVAQNRGFEEDITHAFSRLGIRSADLFDGSVCSRKEGDGLVTYHFTLGLAPEAVPEERQEDLATNRAMTEGIKAIARKNGGKVYDMDMTKTFLS